MQNPSPDPPPPNDPSFPRHHPDKVSSSPKEGGGSSGDRLLRTCWIVLGIAFSAVFAFTVVTILVKGHGSRTSEATGPATADLKSASDEPQPDSDVDRELLSPDGKTAANEQPPHVREVHRVLGHGFTPTSASDSLLPPPLPRPPSLAPKNDDKEPSLPVKTEAPDADAVIEKRLRRSEDEAREKLLAVPELRLFSDLEIQTFRETQKNDKSAVRGIPRDQVDFAFNVQLNKLMRQTALKQGLPLQSGPSCQLPPNTAMIVQTLSKDLREMGFVSVPGVGVRGASPGESADLGAAAKREAFQEWCDINNVEKFRGALATLLQMLQVEDAPTRLLLVRELAKVKSPAATAVLAKRAMVDLAPEVRDAAVAALEKRPAAQFVPVLLQGLRYPLPPVADRAALALRKLKPEGALPRLVALLDQHDPSLPVLDKRTKKPVVRELVRLNHMRNCLLCHAPSGNSKDGLVRGLVPTPGKSLPRLYYAGQRGNFVRADITFLRQDFSVNLPVKAAAPWPNEQRFDFVTRLRPAKPEEIKEIAAKPEEIKEIAAKPGELRGYPQRQAVLYALRGLTGKDGGDSSEKWRELLGIARDKDSKLDKTKGSNPP